MVAIKLSLGCTDCGYDDDPKRLEFDHLSPEGKRLNVGDMTSYSVASILLEVEKCEVVCDSCHARRTQRRLGHLLKGDRCPTCGQRKTPSIK